MLILDRVAQHNGFNSWTELVEDIGTGRELNFTIPPYLNYNRTEISHPLILEAIRDANFKVEVDDSSIYVTKNIMGEEAK